MEEGSLVKPEVSLELNPQSFSLGSGLQINEPLERFCLYCRSLIISDHLQSLTAEVKMKGNNKHVGLFLLLLNTRACSKFLNEVMSLKAGLLNTKKPF